MAYSIMIIPSLFKVLTGILVDAKVFKQRKVYFTGGSIAMSVLFLMATFADLSPGFMTLTLHLTWWCIVLQDTAIKSIMV